MEIHDIYKKKFNILKIEDEILDFRVKKLVSITNNKFLQYIQGFSFCIKKKFIPFTKKNKSLFI